MENFCEKVALKLDPKSPELIFPFSGVIHPDPLAMFDILRRYFYPAVLDPEAAFFMSRLLVKTPINFKIFTHPPRTAQFVSILHIATFPAPYAYARSRISIRSERNRTNKNRGRISLPIGYNIQAMMHAVNQINVPNSWFSEHNFAARSPAAKSMRGVILRANIRFNFCYNTGDFTLPHLTY